MVKIFSHRVFSKQLLFVLVLFVCFSNNTRLLYAQDKDFELWNEINLKRDFNKHFSCTAGLQLRLDQNASSIKSVFPEISLLYNLNKYVRFNIDYRFIMINKANNSYYPKSRYNIGLRLRKKIKPFTFKYKIQYQYGLDNYLYREIFTTDKDNSYIRNKITIDYQFNKKWTPNISAELFYHLQKPESQFDVYRITFGLEYDFNKKNSIECAYFFEKEFNVYKPQSVFALKLKYSYKI